MAAQPAGELHHVVSTFGREIDSLFIIILGITGIVFIGTQVVLVWAAYRFVDQRTPRAGPSAAQYFHGSQRLEVIWTIIPAAILVFIALYQMGTWAEHQVPQRRAQGRAAGRGHRPAVPVGDALPRPRRQAQHRRTTCFTVNDLHFVKNKPALIHLKSSRRHPLVLPAPDADQAGRRAGPDDPGLVRLRHARASYELVCAELCGWGHYKMRGNVTVHETDDEFQKWLDEKLAEQNREPAHHGHGSQGR